MSSAYSRRGGRYRAESSTAPMGRLESKENIMNHVTRRLAIGLVVTAGSLGAAAALASQAYAGVIINEDGEPTSGTPMVQAPTEEFGSALIPCL